VECVVRLDDKSVAIGRDGSNDVVLPEGTISRRHAQVSLQEGVYTVADLGSKGGTFVNGERITESRLNNKDMLNIGSFSFHFEAEGESSGVGDETTSILAETPEKVTWSQRLTEPPEELPEHLSRIVAAAEKEVAEFEEHEYALDRLIQLAMEGVTAERGFLFLRSSDGLLPIIEIDPKIKIRRLNISLTIVNKVLDEEVAVITEDASMDPKLDGSVSVAALGIRSALAIPLRDQDGVMGVVYLDTTDPVRRFSKEDLSLLIAFGALAEDMIKEDA